MPDMILLFIFGISMKLTFLVPNFRTNSTIIFKYLEKSDFDGNFKNPFQVYNEGTCKENVT